MSEGQTKNSNTFSKIMESLAINNGFQTFRFVGGQGTGKTAATQEFAEQLKSQNIKSPVTTHVYQGTEGGAEDFRKFLNLSRLKPVGRQIFIVENSDALSSVSLSGLLKILEEAKPNNIFILIDQQDILPATIISRCMSVRFTPSPEKNNSNVKKQDVLKDTTAVGLSVLSLSQRLIVANRLAEEPTFNLQKIILDLVEQTKQHRQNLAIQVKRLSTLQETYTALDKNQNKKMVMENLMFQW